MNSDLRQRVRLHYRGLHGIDCIDVRARTFKLVQLHSNNRFYKFLMNVCELIHDSWLPDEVTGSYRFRNFLRDKDRMGTLFQSFLFNFIKIECPGWKKSREHIFWKASSSTDPELKLLPRMETDISLTRLGEHLIIEAKYYRETLSKHHDVGKIHGDNLYQLASYLLNRDAEVGQQVRGMLLYPRVDRTLRETYTILGKQVDICTVDLGQKEWATVHDEICELVR